MPATVLAAAMCVSRSVQPPVVVMVTYKFVSSLPTDTVPAFVVWPAMKAAVVAPHSAGALMLNDGCEMGDNCGPDGSSLHAATNASASRTGKPFISFAFIREFAAGDGAI